MDGDPALALIGDHFIFNYYWTRLRFMMKDNIKTDNAFVFSLRGAYSATMIIQF